MLFGTMTKLRAVFLNSKEAGKVAKKSGQTTILFLTELKVEYFFAKTKDSFGRRLAFQLATIIFDIIFLDKKQKAISFIITSKGNFGNFERKSE